MILPQPILSPGSRVNALSIDESGDSLSQVDKNAMAREIQRRRDRKGREGQIERGKRLAPSSGNEISAKTIARQSFTDTATVSWLPKSVLASIVSNWYLYAVKNHHYLLPCIVEIFFFFFLFFFIDYYIFYFSFFISTIPFFLLFHP